MTNIDGVRAALLKFVESMPIDTTLVLLLKTDELVVAHAALATMQELHEAAGTGSDEMEVFGRLRHKIEKALSQAGYGGDPR